MKIGKTACMVAGVILIVVLLRGCVATSYLIPSTGMENSLYCGERIIVNKWSYGLRLPFMRLWDYHRWAERPVQKEDILVFNNPANFSEPVIDRREVFISRCIGIPGDTLLIDSLFSVIPSEKNAPDQKFLYAYPKGKECQLDSLLSILSITPNKVMGQDSTKNVRSFSRYEYYLLEQALSGNCWIVPVTEENTATSLKPLIVPGKGKAIRVYPWNMTLLRNTLVLHEKKRAEIKNDTLYIEGRPVQHCYFTKDYYWMSANNSINLSDSRLFGFVPKDHIIGKASLVWFSKEKDTGIWKGYRWNRMWRAVK
ncbi:signal peptidase I [Bacteroides helcogenes]|uniref:Signal peptidase I n=1 Tax=Bacteroides helcogenes (strain ATCC 35417 / DSM 20613 / JCM 6297 / CCUG 15421 / P 36-108) TaxID=693979 RepID=E6SWL5_BACT6|nr:signal peptidase I [Bacteroides helcogenes]ADV42613.1 signal peptidase I [Bacteroides helcogenes P 36-108]MDY5237625.1 signal peptidase I [Bacteroides helcogenes]